MAVTRDLITKYHYFHTSFQIWPDQIKVRERGRENCTLSRSLVQGWLQSRVDGHWEHSFRHCGREAAARGDAQGSPTGGTDQAVVSPGTLQAEVNTTMYGSCLRLVHPTDTCEAHSVSDTEPGPEDTK